jgi:alpha-galactosidase
MPKICFLGAGSAFIEPLSRDLFQMQGVESSTLVLVDIDEQRLELSHKLAEHFAKMLACDWKIEATTNRIEALDEADYIINCVEIGGLDAVRAENDIPLKYGISQCIGDTIGPGGVFKLLRTGPTWLEMLRDCERLCPDALVLNYTNPMNMMCLAANASSFMRVVGLCHSVQGTSGQLAEYAGLPLEELDFACGGINHLAWFTRLEHKGEDLYPRLRERALARDEVYEKDPVRFDMMLHFGAFITESSGHLSEYVPWYRKRRELIDEYTRPGYLGEENFYANNWPQWRSDADQRRQKILSGEETDIDLKRSVEYASRIIEAHQTGTPYVIHGNVMNDSLIDNLPFDGCVEVACLVNRNGVQPTHFGALPPAMAAICRSNMSVFEIGTLALLERSKEATVHALCLDPLTSAVCSLSEIRKMTEELFETLGELLQEYA